MMLLVDMAPEIVRRTEYEGKPVDMWSMGILLYALLCGCFPFRAKAYPDLYRRIARGTFVIPEELSSPVKDLLRQLLTVDAETRVTAHHALRHPWLQVQFLNAPNMDKLRQEMTVLISEKPADDLDEQVLAELQTYGMSRDEVIRLVLTKTHSSLATLYYLLLDMLVTRRRREGKSGRQVGPSINSSILPTAGVTATTTTGQRPLSANYAASLKQQQQATYQPILMSNNPVTSAVPVIKTGATYYNNNTATTNNNTGVFDQQQQLAEQLASQHLLNRHQQQQHQQQQQQILERQEYRYRPKSATQNRVVASAAVN